MLLHYAVEKRIRRIAPGIKLPRQTQRERLSATQSMRSSLPNAGDLHPGAAALGTSIDAHNADRAQPLREEIAKRGRLKARRNLGHNGQTVKIDPLSY